jgi:hypothetical protein
MKEQNSGYLTDLMAQVRDFWTILPTPWIIDFAHAVAKAVIAPMPGSSLTTGIGSAMTANKVQGS